MPITVNGPNGITVNFPDGTDAATIHGAMSQATGYGKPVTDLSSLSDADLKALYSQKTAAVDPSSMSDEQLKQAYAARSPAPDPYKAAAEQKF